jgi:hypothetical protein
MAREATEKPLKAGPDLRPMIPTMADDALRNLHANAQRLETAGSTAQRAMASELLPLIEAELDVRKTAAAAQRAERAKAQVAKRKSKSKVEKDAAES